MSAGLASFTVARVARAARVSTALVHYHFATKQRLLLAAAERLASRRTDARLARLAGRRGLAAVDALWEEIVASAGRDAERGWHDLVLVARADTDVAHVLIRERAREVLALARDLPGLLEELGARRGLPPEEAAGLLVTFLDGVACSLAMGSDRREIRGAFDAFWLALVALDRSLPAS